MSLIYLIDYWDKKESRQSFTIRTVDNKIKHIFTYVNGDFYFSDIVVPKSSLSDLNKKSEEIKDDETEDDVFYDTEDDPDEDSDEDSNDSSS